MLTCASLTFLAFQLFLLLVKNPLHFFQVNVIQVCLAQLQFIYSFIYLFNCVCVRMCVCERESFLIILCQFRQPPQNSCANCGLQRPFKNCENKVNVVVVVVGAWSFFSQCPVAYSLQSSPWTRNFYLDYCVSPEELQNDTQIHSLVSRLLWQLPGSGWPNSQSTS